MMYLLILSLTATQAFLLSAKKDLTGQVLYSCDFENDTCQMATEPSSSEFTWLRFAGSTASENTGPDFDHTTLTAEGHYMYAEATEFEPGQVATLRLPSLIAAREAKGQLCLSFWYHMYGEHIGTLNVTQNDTVLSSIRFNQTYNWFQQNVTIRDPSVGSIAFVTVRGGADIGQPFGDIAIDDVVVYNDSCEYEITTEETTTTTTTTTVTTTTESITPTKSSTVQTSLITNETAATTTTAAILTSEEVTMMTSTAALPVMTSTQSNLATELQKDTTDNSIELSQNSSYTNAVFTKSRSNNDSSIEIQMNSTETNTTIATQANTSSTEIIFGTTVTASEANDALSNTSIISKAASPAPVGLTSPNGTTSVLITDSTSDNSSTMNTYTGNSNVSYAPRSEGWQSTTPGLKTIDPISQANSSKKVWNLTEQHLILILALLSALILILILVVAVLACCLCVTKRKYNVERSANVYNSSTTLDSRSAADNQRGGGARKNYVDYS